VQLSQEIAAIDRESERLCKERYPETGARRQMKGAGTLASPAGHSQLKTRSVRRQQTVLETLSQIGELVGGFGALVAQINLATQIRQNYVIARAQSRQTLIEPWSAGNWDLARDSELLRAFAAGLSPWPISLTSRRPGSTSRCPGFSRRSRTARSCATPPNQSCRRGGTLRGRRPTGLAADRLPRSETGRLWHHGAHRRV
jgi:hypothetical protein